MSRVVGWARVHFQARSENPHWLESLSTDGCTVAFAGSRDGLGPALSLCWLNSSFRSGKTVLEQCLCEAPARLRASISLSKSGQPTENAFAESFFKIVKWEEVYLHQYRTFEEAQASLQTFLEDV